MPAARQVVYDPHPHRRYADTSLGPCTIYPTSAPSISTSSSCYVGFIIQATLIPADWLPYLSNGIAWWLSVEPYELLFYIFLPPLLLDAALRIDTFRLKKVWMPVLCLAYVIVLCATGLLIPIMLYVFNLQNQGWCVFERLWRIFVRLFVVLFSHVFTFPYIQHRQWQYAALFGAMVAPTDAVAIVAVLKECTHTHVASRCLYHTHMRACMHMPFCSRVLRWQSRDAAGAARGRVVAQ